MKLEERHLVGDTAGQILRRNKYPCKLKSIKRWQNYGLVENSRARDQSNSKHWGTVGFQDKVLEAESLGNKSYEAFSSNTVVLANLKRS